MACGASLPPGDYQVVVRYYHGQGTGPLITFVDDNGEEGAMTTVCTDPRTNEFAIVLKGLVKTQASKKWLVETQPER